MSQLPRLPRTLRYARTPMMRTQRNLHTEAMQPSYKTHVAPVPSSAPIEPRLIRAALSGLLAVGAIGCGKDDASSSKASDSSKSELSDQELKAVCSDMVKSAQDNIDYDQACKDKIDVDMVCADKVDAAKKDSASQVDLSKSCADMVSAAKNDVDLDKACADMVKNTQSDADKKLKDLTDKCEPLVGTVEAKTTSSEQKEYTFAALTQKCADAGGYIEISGHCAGTNTCRGFTYGDWGPSGATLTEHTCAGVNGCNGLYCMVLPKDSGKSGKEIYETKMYGDPGPSSCLNCHAVWNDDETMADATKFKVYQFADGTRNKDTWLNRTTAEQERLVAFGVHGVRPDGVAYRNMAPYKDYWSRAEISRVVQYVRTLEPLFETIKVADP